MTSSGQILGQRDSELLISFLTVPYIRLPLVLTFFASDDRVHKLQSLKLRNILDSLLFEPGRYLSVDMTGVEPVMCPTQHPSLLATSYGHLLNELVRSPSNVISTVNRLVEGVLALDTGSVCDPGDDVADFNVSTDIILYSSRLGSRVESYITFLIQHATGTHPRVDTKLRDVEVTEDCIATLQQGLAELRGLLLGQLVPLLEDYISKLHLQCVNDPLNQKLIDRNSRLACDLHAHRLILYRNQEMDANVATAISGSFVFLTTR